MSISLGQKIFGKGFDPRILSEGIGNLATGLVNNSGDPYRAANNEYKKYFDKAQAPQNPFYNTGINASNSLNNSLNSMSNPNDFMRNLTSGYGSNPSYSESNRMANPTQYFDNIMGGYKQSPFAKFRTQQSIRAANNAASAGGLIGSTPLAQANADYAGNIASEDMNNYLAQILGINQQYQGNLNNYIGNSLNSNAQYLNGEQSLAQGGQHSADIMSQLYGKQGELMGEGSLGAEYGDEQDTANILGGIGSIASMFFL